MEQQIRELIEAGDYQSARQLMMQWKEQAMVYTDTMAILDATICDAMEERGACFEAIRAGLKYAYNNYELYYMLGYYYLPVNMNQAYMCLQNALFYCDKTEDKALIQADLEQLEATGQVGVVGTTILIVSYNACYLQQKNIESIRETVPKDQMHILVVDNGSEDGIVEWMRDQEDIYLVENGENLGFSKACNIGVNTMLSMGWDEDVLLLNNDTRLAPNTLFWLKMGLYEADNVGATGSISNYAGNNQMVDIEFPLPGDYLSYGSKINIPEKSPYEERVRLSGFAMLIKSGLWKQVGGMDEAFSPGYFEDDDLSMKLVLNGYRLLVCKNSFLYHAGSQSFSKREDINELLMDHYRLFIEKYGFPILEYAYPTEGLVEQIPFDREQEFNVLQIGCGLGADLKHLRRVFPKAHVVGVEKETAMRRIASKSDVVVDSIETLSTLFTNRVFQVLIITPEEQVKLTERERSILNSICTIQCKILPQQEKKLTLEKIKLVIWDMDQTFWKGILSEGTIELLPRNMELVKRLTDCGIVNSISSKNNSDEVLEVLEKCGMRSYFVFADISWENKGQQIRKKLEDMHLRAENVLFVDDDPRNLEEASFYNEGIMVASPNELQQLVLYYEKQIPKDLEHKRLEQYQLLERKREAQSRFESKEAFLYDSKIQVELGTDCFAQVDRIVELIARSNQLNFTKVRDTKEQLLPFLEDATWQKGYVKAKDRFGDYGLIGFYCMDPKGQVRHFLFSCRVVGMGIVEWLYQYLGTPSINVVAPTAQMLDKNAKAEWVTLAEEQMPEKRSAESENRMKILLKGPCDMSAIESYLIGGDLTCEFTFVNDSGFITSGHNHSMNIWQSANLTKAELHEIVKEVPFITWEDFETSIFEKEYHAICFSLLTDSHAGLYRNKSSGHFISFGSKNFDLTDKKNWAGYIDGTIVNHAFPFTEEILQSFANNWEFVGSTNEMDLLRNMDYIVEHVKGNPKIILILGSEIEAINSNEEFANHAETHKQLNAAARALAMERENLYTVEITNFIHSQEDYVDGIDHFSRRVYYELATEVVRLLNA